jgi:2-keto-4-pentenoate hydratase/2-oxohepta-3-ene-1,7-dioic acid hydratase in catechol pathway
VKLVTFRTKNGEERIGALLADLSTIADFRAASGAAYFVDMLALIDGGPAALADAKRIADDVAAGRDKTAAVKLSDVKLLAPLPVPRQMRDFLAFELHYKQARAQALRIRAATYPDPAAAAVELAKTDEFKIPPVWYEQPVYYKGNRFSVIGTEEDVQWPSYCQKLDFELEFGAVVGRKGKNIPRDKAREYIFGYCIFNDMSARDAQYREYPGRLGPAKGKDFDTGNILGPWLVTADEVGDPYNLTMIARVNGEEWGRGNSGTMYHKFEDMIAHASKEETLHPGELLGSGTVGNGCGLEYDRWLKPGDVIELEIEKLGTLRNRVVKPAS